MRRALLAGLVVVASGLLAPSRAAASDPHVARVQAAVATGGLAELRAWDDRVLSLVRAGELRLRLVREDTLVPGRQHERLAQFYKGVPVFGGELTRQTDGAATLSVFGTFYEGIDLDVTPAFPARELEAALARMSAEPFGSKAGPELMVLPRGDDGYALAWRVRVKLSNGRFDIRVMFFDGRTGELLLDYSDLQTQSVGSATGVLADRKKLSGRQAGNSYVADDRLRPPVIVTYDFRGNLPRLLALQSLSQLTSSDLAADADNVWTDGANVDAHVYAGYVYDYYFKRMGRRGLDNANIPMISITHPARREEIFSYLDFLDFYLNAFYAGDGLMVYGEGLPPNLRDSDGKAWNYVAGALDIVGHELTHGVTDYSSNLIYLNESGALNESFSDMMGVAVEFFYQPAGSGSLRADYLIGEDVITPGGIRSMQAPAAYGDPDHYSLRYTGREDNGGVHINSGIPNNAYCLAIEGGTHRFSGVAVQGVGAANREQIEKVFYRAFTALLPPSATFSQARAATIQSARELYGVGSSAERAVTQAWTAVGVN